MKMTDVIFHEITLQDKKWMDEKFAEDDRNACEYTFANNFIWRKVYCVEVAELYGCLLVRFVEDGEYCYSYPVGKGDKRAALIRLLEFCSERREPLILSPLSEEDRQQLEEWFPRQFIVDEDRPGFDYIYSREKLATLAGKKLHGKRNHIARFKEGGDWSYEPLTEENLEECRRMTYTWIHMRAEKWTEEMEEEIEVLHEAFDHMQELGLVGGLIRREGQIVAFAVGEPQNSDTFVVHFEKAYPDLQGAYPMINQQFVLHACEGYEYVNREDDTGEPGLRQAKLSYYPDILLKKYVARSSRVVYADREKDKEALLDLWLSGFQEDAEDFEFFREHRMKEDTTLVICEEGRVVSMASFLPAEYYSEGVYHPARYVYALATLPEYRRRGLAREIMEFALQKYEEPLILVPAEETLIPYYESMGFFRAFPQGELVWEEAEAAETEWVGESPTLEKASAEEYRQIRDSFYEKEGYVRWDTDAVSYAIRLAEQNGGTALVIETESPGTPEGREAVGERRRDILVYEVKENVLEIEETTLCPPQLGQVLPQLLEKTGTDSVKCSQLMGMLWLPERMRQQKNHGTGYFNLQL